MSRTGWAITLYAQSVNGTLSSPLAHARKKEEAVAKIYLAIAIAINQRIFQGAIHQQI
jgi:hypothetical protein